MNLVYDKKSKSVFEASQIGNHINLKGVNLGGSFKIPAKLFNLDTISEGRAAKLVSNGKWPLVLAEILSHKVKVTTVRINFNPPKEKPKAEKPAKPEKKKEIKEVKAKSGVTTLNDICQQLGIKPASARGKLRGVIDKPSEGWKWTDPKEVEKVVKVLNG